MKTIKYNKNLSMTDLNYVAHGTGARYLEVIIDDDHGVLIAKQWHRKFVTTDNIHSLVDMG
jgi:ABC-type branched-subunit amino acid transport system substrate-binding protein